MTLQKYFSHPSFSYKFFSNPTHKTETATASRWETTNSNPDGPIKAVNKYNLTVFIRLFQGSSRALKSCAPFQGPSSLPVDSLDSTDEPHPSLHDFSTEHSMSSNSQLRYSIIHDKPTCSLQNTMMRAPTRT